jgi:hypothetical protein
MRCLKKIGYSLVFSVMSVCFFSSNGACASIMVDKNLFAPDRKPPSPESAVAPPQPNKPGLSAKAIQLDGVIIRGDTKKALVRVKGQIPGADKAKTQNPYIAVGEGEKLGDFQVIRIENRSISLEKDGQTEVVGLFAEGKMVVPPPPTPASPAPPAPAQQVQAPPAPPSQVGAQPVQPPFPQGHPGVNMPGVAPPPSVAKGRREQQRMVAPQPPGQFDDNPAPDEEVEIDEEEQ